VLSDSAVPNRCVLCARKGNTHSHFLITFTCVSQPKEEIRHQNAEPIATLDHPALELARHQHCSDPSFAATTPSVAPLAATALALAAAAIVTATITSTTIAITAATIALATAAVGAAIPAAAT
jgi:hypothetical protein